MPQNQPPSEPARTIDFPSGYRFGDLSLVQPSQRGDSWYQEMTPRNCRAAKGPMLIPAGSNVRLSILYNGALNVAPLAMIKANDLQSLDMTRVEMHKDTGKYVSHLVGLKEVLASDTEAGDEFVHYLLPLQNLEGLVLNRTTVSDKALADIAKLKNLKILSLNSNSLTDKGLASLANLTSLSALHLEKTDLTDDGLQFLLHMKNIRKLLLSGTKISDKGLATIGKLQSLHYLEISRTNVRGPGLIYLEKLPHLTGIQVSEDTVAPHCIAALRKNKPHCAVTTEKVRDGKSWMPILK